jgi:hypothetical protein
MLRLSPPQNPRSRDHVDRTRRNIDRMIKQAKRNQSVRDGSSKYPRFPGESRGPPLGGTSGGDMGPGFRRDSGRIGFVPRGSAKPVADSKGSRAAAWMRIVLDTNVSVSAVLKLNSLPFLVVRWIDRHGGLLKSAVTEQKILNELCAARFPS